MNRELEWLKRSVDRRPFRDEFFSAGVALATIEGELFRRWMKGHGELATQSIVPAGKAFERFSLAHRRYTQAGTQLEGLPYLLHQGVLARRFYPIYDKLDDDEVRAAAPLVELKLGVIAALNRFAEAIHTIIDSEVDEALRKVHPVGMATTPQSPRPAVTFDQLVRESEQELGLIGKAIAACDQANVAIDGFLKDSSAWFGTLHLLPESWDLLEHYLTFPGLKEEWRAIRATTLEHYSNEAS